METGKFVKHDREFWIEKWKSFHGDQGYSSMRNLHHGRKWCNGSERKERLDAMIAEGKSPKDIWISHMEELSKDGHIFNVGPLADPEMKQNWEEMKKDGKTKEFWERYWDEKQKDPKHFGSKFINPQEMQKRWEEMESEGKTPEEFWNIEREKMFEKMQGSRWGSRGLRDKFWTKQNDDNTEGVPTERFYHHFHRCGHRHYWGRNKKRDYDDDPLFKEFDF